MTAVVWVVAAFIAEIVLVVVATRTRAALSGNRPKAWWVPVLQIGLGLLAALFLLSILVPTSHPRNFESPVIGDLRTFSSAQFAFNSSTGVFGSPECLVRPTQCGLVMDPSIRFLPEDAVGPKHEEQTQYRFIFYPGAEAAPALVKFPAGIKGYSEWAYVAVPSTKGTLDYRSFCVDETGEIRYATHWQKIVVIKGRCPEGLQLVR